MRELSYIPHAPEMLLWDDLVDRLKVLDIRYLSGGSSWEGRPSGYSSAQEVPIAQLISDLAQAPHPRLRDALVALLFRHPQYAVTARSVAVTLRNEQRARLLVLASIVAASALQQAWKFTLDIYLPGRSSIEADDLAAELGVPSPHLDYGRASLQALSTLLARDQPFPFDYARGWSDAAEHVLDDLRTEAS